MTPIEAKLVYDTMRDSDMLGDAADETLHRLIAASRLRTYKSNDTLFWENDPTGTAYLVCTGKVSIERFSEDGKTITITTRQPGEVIGEISIFEDVPRTADARATMESKVAIISGEAFILAIKSDGELALGVIRSLSKKLHDSIDHRTIQSWKLPRRLASLLVELARDQSEKVEGKGWILANSPTQEEMATRIGCTREHLNRAFKQFREEGIVMTEGRTIVIRKLKALKSAAGLD